MTLVVDTNVAVVANGRDTHADLRCQLACVEKLTSVKDDAIVVAVDCKGEILAEYARRLKHSGAPGVGDAFFKYVRDNQYWADRIRRVQVTSTDDCRGFEELPPNKLDPSDQKFLAVAVVTRATILNATESDWHEQAPLLEELDVEVRQLCPKYKVRQARDRRTSG